MVGGSIPHEAKAGPLCSLVFDGIGNAESKWSLSADDTVTAPKVFVGREKVHRATLTLRAPRFLAVEFGHALVHLHAYGDGMTMIPVGRDDVILFGHA